MARPLSIAELQAELESVLEDAANGEVTPIMHQGKVVAEIGPPAGKRRLGRMVGTVRFLGDVVAPLEEPWGETD